MSELPLDEGYRAVSVMIIMFQNADISLWPVPGTVSTTMNKQNIH